MRRPLASPARLRAAARINDATNPVYHRGRYHARLELARELRRRLTAIMSRHAWTDAAMVEQCIDEIPGAMRATRGKR